MISPRRARSRRSRNVAPRVAWRYSVMTRGILGAAVSGGRAERGVGAVELEENHARTVAGIRQLRRRHSVQKLAGLAHPFGCAVAENLARLGLHLQHRVVLAHDVAALRDWLIPRNPAPIATALAGPQPVRTC